jgi:diguanylate cyclase (GGDEF)-like protein
LVKQLKYLRRKFATVQEWTGVERGCIPIFLTGLIYLQYFFWGLFALGFDDTGKMSDHQVLWVQSLVLMTIITTSALLVIFGLRLNRRQPEALWFQHLGANFYGLCLVWGGYLVGTLSLPAGVVLAGAPIMGFLILDRRVMAVAIAIAFANILAFNLASAHGLLPYAPMLRTPGDVESALFWTGSHVFFAAPHLIVNTTICAVLLGQWRRREALVRALSLTDALTQVHNRRSILALLEAEVARSQRHGPTLAVALLDLDHFKTVNDTFGHPAGDRVLQEAARVLGATLRQNDAVGRFGGEEFLLLMPHTTRAEAEVVLERCRAQLAALDLRADNGERIPVSASFGFAVNGGSPAITGDLLVQAADQALYRAKQAGRNRVAAGDAAALAAGTAHPAPVRAVADATNATGNRGWWKSLEGWREQTAGVLEWSMMARAALMLGLLLALQAGVLLYLLVTPHVPSAAAQLDMGVVRLLTWVQLAQCAVSVLLLGLALHFRRRGRTDSRWFEYLTTQYFAIAAASMVFDIGILGISTGGILTVGPMVGFILFRRAPVLAATVTSVTCIVVLAYASALGWVPYAPMASLTLPGWQLATPFWVFTHYLFFVPVMGVGLMLAVQIFGRWREREAQFRALSLTDALTGVHNRRSILALLDREVARTFRLGPPLAVVILDLDHFKKINDTYGHPTGDRVLQEAARALTASLRKSDAVGRYGGEEFLLLLPDTSMEGAVVLAERCRQQVAALEISADNGERFRISASFGLASNEKDYCLYGETLVKVADGALYRAKESGRNRVEAVLATTR